MRNEQTEREQAESEGRQKVVAYWLDQIDQSRKRERNYRKEARKVLRIYENREKRKYSFNILFSNTETMLPALYNAAPRPVVKRKHGTPGGVDLAVANATKAILEHYQDVGDPQYETFDSYIGAAVLGALVPGRGVTWFKYDAEFTKAPAVEPASIETSEGSSSEETETLDYETVCGEDVPWDHFFMGYARKWIKVPWIARLHAMTREELIDNFGELGRRVRISSPDEKRDDETPADGYPDTADVYEIWDKVRREVLFICEGSPEAPLRRISDPLSLSGFFPCPEPLQFVRKVSDLIPVPLYSFYEEQADELSRVTQRINKIVAGMKVRGMYDATLQGIDRVMESEDNKLIPADGVAAMQQGQTLDRSIWLMPIEKHIAVLQQLYIQREQVKQVIYEIIGIADILRGASVASETATAQSIKSQWGSIRLKRVQKEVARYARDSLRIIAEIAAKHISQETLSEIAELELPTAEEKAAAGQLVAMAQQSPEVMQSVPPEMADKVQGVASGPSQEEVFYILKNDLIRSYHIDIETNSTVDIEATEDKALVGEFLNALAQFLNGVAPMISQGILPFEAAKSIMLAVTRKYRFGDEVEESLLKMAAPSPKPEDNSDQAKLAAEQAKLELESKKHEDNMQMRAAEMQHTAQQSQTEMQQKLLEMQQEAEFQKERAGMELSLEKWKFEQQLAADLQKAHLDAEIKLAIAKMQQETIIQTNQQRSIDNAMQTQLEAKAETETSEEVDESI